MKLPSGVAVLLLFLAAPAGADPLLGPPLGASEWRREVPTVPAIDVLDFAHGAGGIVAVGKHGLAAVRGAGGSWITTPTGTNAALRAVTWTGSQYIAVGRRGTVLSSLDGRTWTERDSGTDADLSGVAAGPGGLLIAVGADGTILWSETGLAWAPGESGVGVTLRDVAWNGEGFLAVGSGGVLLSSSNGFAWAETDLPVSPFAVHWTGSRWLVGGVGGILESPDGVAWSDVTPAGGGTTFAFAGTDDGLLAVGTDVESVDWEARGRVAHSSDGLSWEVLEADFEFPLRGALAAPGLWLVGGDEGLLLGTDDPAGEWRQEPGRRGHLRDALEWEGAFYVVGDGGLILTDDGVGRWRQIDPGTGLSLRGLAAGPDRLVAVGVQGTVLVTLDGVDWEAVPAITSAPLTAVAWGAGRFVAVGSEGTALVSEDGLAWQSAEVPTDRDLEDVAFAEGVFVAVGRVATILTSADGIAWELHEDDSVTIFSFERFAGVVRHGEEFVALKRRRPFRDVLLAWVSPDGEGWERIVLSVPNLDGSGGTPSLLALASTGDELVVVGDRPRAVILAHPYPFVPWPL